MDQIPEPRAGKGEVVVKLIAAAFNRRDYWIRQGLYPNITYPLVPGSDGVGLYNGREVIIDAGLEWGDDERVQSKEFRLFGSPGQGTFAEKIAVPSANVYDKPAHLSLEQAAALPVAGVTAYRALFSRGVARAGERLLVTGIGGGVALTVLQFAIATGVEVYVTSGHDYKIQRAMDLGARGGANYNREDWLDVLGDHGGFDIVIDGAGGPGVASLLKLCNPGGRVVIYGGSTGKIDGISPQLLFWRQLSILGTTMGSPVDFRHMLDFVNRHQVVPVIDKVYEMEGANGAMHALEKSTQFGKLVMRIK